MAQGLPDRTKTVMPTTTMRQNIPFEIQKEVQVSEVAPNIMTMREGGRISSEQLKPLLDMGVPENELKEIIFKESSGNPRAVNPSSNAVGLFQFTESAIKDLNKFKNTNITKDEILKMSVPKQVDLYKKYLERWRWKPGTSLGVLQAAPGFANRAKDTVIYKKGSNAAKLNKQWQDSAGNITVKSIEDFYDFASGKSKKGKQPLIEAGEVKAPSKVTPLIQDKKPEQTTIKTPTKKESKDTGFVESAKEVGSGLLNLLGRDYTVEKGDTLSAIAEKSGVSVEDLLESNPNIVDRDKISIGQEVDIPNFKSFVGKFKDAFGLKEGGDVGKYFEGQVEGEGDGMSDEITFRVEGGNPDYALLSKDEYVLPADVVSMLGNGSSDAGSDELDQFVKDTRKQAFGREEQQTQIDPEEGLSSLV
jgi:LysM repeat protein